MKKKLQILILIIVPLLFLVIGFSFDRTRYGTDPESAYMLNGLNIAMGRSVGHFDHPGTPVQVFDAAIITVTHWLRFSGTNLETDVLLHSETYIEAIRYSLIVMNTLILLALGFVAFSFFGNIWLSLVLQITPFLSDTLAEELFTKVAPEPFLFATVALLAMLVFRYYKSEDKNNKYYIFLFALLSGFGLAIKVTFLPFLIVPFLILKGWPSKIRFSLLVFPSFILFTLPAVKGYPYMAKWFLNLGTHTGIYGQGNKGFIDPLQYMNSLKQIAVNNKELVVEMFVATLVLVVLWLIRKRNNEKKSDFGLLVLLSFILAQGGTILLVAKQYSNNHYLFPALSLIGVVTVFLYLVVSENCNERGLKILNSLLPLLVAGIIGVAILHKPYLSIAYEGYRMSNKSTNETMARIERDYPNYVKTYFYPGSFNEMAQLRWGNVYAKQIHTEALMKLFPKGLFYFWWERNFQLWETTIPPGELLKRYGGKILLIGGPNTPEEFRQVEEAGLKLNKLFEGRIQVVYEIDTARSSFFHNATKPGTTQNVLKTDFETFSDDQQWIMADGQKFSKKGSLTTEKPRSGNYSFAMPHKDMFAMEYQLKDVKPGQEYELSIWRLGGDEDASLVVAAYISDLFYVKSKGTTEKDASGWNKISMTIRVPEGFPDDKLKVYLWNHGNKPAWFDDFEIDQYK